MSKQCLLLVILSGLTCGLTAGSDSTEVSAWTHKGTVGSHFNQTLLKDWNAGGQNSTHAGLLLRHGLTYQEGKLHWETLFDAAYAVAYQEPHVLKTDDKLALSTRLDWVRKADPLLKFSGFGSFKTQFMKGFKKPEDSLHLSTFFAPAYGIGGLGIIHKQPGVDLYVSPVTSKWTLVMDPPLRDAGSFGLLPGQHSRKELGAYANLRVQHQFSSTIKVDFRVNVFENYLDAGFFPDIDGDMLLVFKGDGPLSITLRSQGPFDNDSKIIDSNGDGKNDMSGLQFKQLSGLGLIYQIIPL